MDPLTETYKKTLDIVKAGVTSQNNTHLKQLNGITRLFEIFGDMGLLDQAELMKRANEIRKSAFEDFLDLTGRFMLETDQPAAVESLQKLLDIQSRFQEADRLTSEAVRLQQERLAVMEKKHEI